MKWRVALIGETWQQQYSEAVEQATMAFLGRSSPLLTRCGEVWLPSGYWDVRNDVSARTTTACREMPRTRRQRMIAWQRLLAARWRSGEPNCWQMLSELLASNSPMN
jgi:hypothetical protein